MRQLCCTMKSATHSGGTFHDICIFYHPRTMSRKVTICESASITSIINIMKNTSQTKKQFIIKLSLAIAIALLGGIVGYLIGINKSDSTPKQNVPGYITAEAATNQVNNFYQQYLNPKKESPEASRNYYVSQYGSKNLVFYKTYYQHGFDPIVCSVTMPISVTATNVQPGAGATVKARATYLDGTTSDIGLTLVLSSEGFKIDSITCPDGKGNLAPQT